MPRFLINGTIIEIRTKEHQPPHFHVIHPDFNFSVKIETMEVLAGKNNPNAKKAMRWARQNKIKLEVLWRKYHG